MKFRMDTDHNHTYKFCTIYCLQVSTYRHGDGAKL